MGHVETLCDILRSVTRVVSFLSDVYEIGEACLYLCFGFFFFMAISFSYVTICLCSQCNTEKSLNPPGRKEATATEDF